MEVVTKVRRELDGLPTATLHRKRRQEHAHLHATADGCGQHVVVLDEPLGVSLADPELDKESQDEVGGDGGVNADGQEAQEEAQQRRHQEVEASLGEEAV